MNFGEICRSSRYVAGKVPEHEKCASDKHLKELHILILFLF